MWKSISDGLEAIPRKRIVYGMVGLFALTQVVYYLMGIRTDTESLEYSWVMLNLDLLKSNLAQSLWYSHAHPPMMNLFTGVILKLFPGNEKLAFQSIYTLLGLGFYLSAYYLLRAVGIRRLLSLILSTLFMISPTFNLLEHQIAYDWPLCAFLTFSAVLFHLFLVRRQWRIVFLMFCVIGIMCLTRSIFHLLFFAIVFAMVLYASPGHRRKVVTAFLLPFLLVLSIYVKNYLVFHKFAAGSGMGFNAAKVLIRSTSLEERQRWVAEGTVSEIFLVEPAYPLSLFPRKYLEVPGYEDIPALRQPLKRDSVSQNLNHLGYLLLSDDYLKDAKNAALHHPRAAVFGLLSAWYCYFRSTSESVFLEPNRSHILPVVNAYDHVLFGKLPWQIPYGKGYNLYLFLLLGLPLLYVYGARLVLKESNPGVTLDAHQKSLLLYMCVTLAYILLLTNTLELAENQRGQFYTLTFAMSFLGLFLQSIRGRKAQRTPDVGRPATT